MSQGMSEYTWTHHQSLLFFFRQILVGVLPRFEVFVGILAVVARDDICPHILAEVPKTIIFPFLVVSKDGTVRGCSTHRNEENPSDDADSTCVHGGHAG